MSTALDDTVRAISHRPDSKLSILEEYAMATMDFLKRRVELEKWRVELEHELVELNEYAVKRRHPR